MDKITRCITHDGAVMAAAIDSTETVFTAQKIHNTSPVAQQHLADCFLPLQLWVQC